MICHLCGRTMEWLDRVSSLSGRSEWDIVHADCKQQLEIGGVMVEIHVAAKETVKLTFGGKHGFEAHECFRGGFPMLVRYDDREKNSKAGPNAYSRWAGENGGLHSVTHWMPLPEPPR